MHVQYLCDVILSDTFISSTTMEAKVPYRQCFTLSQLCICEWIVCILSHVTHLYYFFLSTSSELWVAAGWPD